MGIKSAGFFNLFDWNKKPRKKISPEELKKDEARSHANENQFHKSMWAESTTYRGPTGPSTSMDEGTRSPGVVARLMGLNSLPMAVSSDPRSSPSSSQSQKRVSEIDVGSKLSSPRKPQTLKSPKKERIATEILPTRSVNPRPTPRSSKLRPDSTPKSSAGTRYRRESKPVKKKTPKLPLPRETAKPVKPKIPAKAQSRNRKKQPPYVSNDVRSSSTEVVSFSFSSPIGRSTAEDYTLNVDGNLGLSEILEKKLRELSEVETEVGRVSCSSPTWDFFPEEEVVPRLQSQCSTTPEPSPVSILEAGFSVESSSTSSETRDVSCRLESLPISHWHERDYIRRLARHADADVAAGRPLDPRLFDLLEEGAPAEGKVQRKELFDCSVEWLDTWRRHQLEHGRWIRGNATSGLVEEISRHLARWRGMGDWMVDEIVAADMGFGPNRWADFDVEKFEVATEVARSVLWDLVWEVFSEFCVR